MFKTQRSVEIEKFIIERALFVLAYSYYNPSLCFYRVVVLMTSEDAGILKHLLFKENKRFNVGQTKDGQEFITTDSYGFVLVKHDLEKLLSDKENFYVLGGNNPDDKFRIIYPDVTLKMIADRELPNLGGRMGLWKKEILSTTKTEIIKNLKIGEENKKKAEEGRKIYAENKKNFIHQMVEKNPVAENLAKRLCDFDLYYSYSDDGDVFRRGNELEKELKKELEEKGFNVEETFSKLHKLKG